MDGPWPISFHYGALALAHDYCHEAVRQKTTWRAEPIVSESSGFDFIDVSWFLLPAHNGKLIDRLEGRIVAECLYAVRNDLVEHRLLPTQFESKSAEEVKSVVPQRRGRKKADYETVCNEANLASEWERAREVGTLKVDFAKHHKMTLADLDRLLDRVAKRKKHSD